MLSFDTFLLMTICPSREIDVMPAQIASLASSQTMAIDHEANELITVTVAIMLEGREGISPLRGGVVAE